MSVDLCEFIQNCSDKEKLRQLYDKCKDSNDPKSIFQLGCFYHAGDYIQPIS